MLPYAILLPAYSQAIFAWPTGGPVFRKLLSNTYFPCILLVCQHTIGEPER